MKNKSKLISLIVVALIVGLYNFVLFMVTKDVSKNTTFWISYGFGMFAFLPLIGVICINNPYQDGTKITLMLPAIRILIVYAIVELLIATLMMALQAITSVTVALLIQVPVLVVFAIIVLVYYLGARHVNSGYAKQKSDVFSKETLCLQVNTLISSVTSPAVKSKLEVISEKIRYSDFNTYPELESQDTLIRSTLYEMKCEEDVNVLKSLATQLERLVDERNEMCKYIKKKRG